MFRLTTAATLALLGLGQVSAHKGCGGHEVARRNPGGPMLSHPHELRSLQKSKRQVTDEASAASSTDPNTECVAYSYQPVVEAKANFPTIWDTAALVNGDSEASALFATINQTVNAKYPNAQPKGTHAGDFTGVNYNATDPDCWWTWRQCTTPAADLGINADVTTVPEPDTWGLGFDDGPNCSHNAFYDYLRDQGQKATMFYIGSNVMDWPFQAQRALADGHEICVHTWSHQYMTSMTNEQAFAELYYTRQAIKLVVGVTPTCWRPPFGDVDNRIRLIAQGLNLTNYVWSDDSEDWRANAPGSTTTEADVTANYQSVVNGAKNGTYATHGPIVLTHELNNFTMGEFMSQYDSIKSAFKYVVPMAAAYNITQPYIESNVTYPDFMTYTNQSSGSSSSSAAGASASSSSTAAGSRVSGASTMVSGGSASASANPSGSTDASAAKTSGKSAAGLTASFSGAFAAAALLAAGFAVVA